MRFIGPAPIAGKVSTSQIDDDAITLAKMASGTDGQILSYDASGNPTAYGPGTDGQVLTSTGAGSPPAFEAAAGGAWTLIGSQAADNSADNLTQTGLSSTYSTFAIVCSSIHPATDDEYIYLRLGDSSGIDSGASDYSWGTRLSYHWPTATQVDLGSGGDSKIGTVGMTSSTDRIGNATGEGWSIHAFLDAYGELYPNIYGHVTYRTAQPVTRHGYFSGMRLSGITVDRVQITTAGGGNLVSGRMSVFGVKHT